jgi:hypothetical protein
VANGVNWIIAAWIANWMNELGSEKSLESGKREGGVDPYDPTRLKQTVWMVSFLTWLSQAEQKTRSGHLVLPFFLDD